ncbi:PREDICTED: F-box/LRR-repeat protein At3g60040-like [Camelina sativa]|uniref:F-box/LRR-repeat protein At3g60040-like n=1 Tax=Camelina sativa TaxID=90675 RepID=A0ABM1RRR8_CAMSA|nr:PREDICTED: F-box/LRR-repeat protein At3g60040-like [Camelina sativa]
MDTKELDTGSNDAISWLPHEVLGDILSRVPTKLAASTSVLSRKWRDVFALRDSLDFDDSASLKRNKEGKLERDVILRECFRNFVDRTLALQLQCASLITRFSLRYHVRDDSEMDHVVRWVCNVLERGVVDLHVSLAPHDEIFLPPALYTSKTLVKLSLGTKISLGKLPPDLSLPALKTLFIDAIFFEYEDLCYVLLPGCPVLEELFVRHNDFYAQPYCISSRTIHKLTVQYDSNFDIGSLTISFDAPSLVFLDYSDYALSGYPQVNLKSLVEARLDLRYHSKEIKRPNIWGLFTGISHIKTLHLSANSADVISRCVKHGLILPVFNNLVSLTFGSKNKRGWRLLPQLLKQCPMLETLTIQGLDGHISDVTMHTAKDLEHLKSLLGTQL